MRCERLEKGTEEESLVQRPNVVPADPECFFELGRGRRPRRVLESEYAREPFLGARLGARTALRAGAWLVRLLIVVVSCAMALRLMAAPGGPLAFLLG